LWRRQENDDLIAASAAEVGATFNGLTLMLGMIWGRPAWGVWWVWDARLTSTLVLFLIFLGYLALRAFVDDPEQKARWSAAVGAIGALNVPIVYMSVKWWRTLHQPQSSPATLDPAYTMGFAPPTRARRSRATAFAPAFRSRSGACCAVTRSAPAATTRSRTRCPVERNFLLALAL
jgi:hypothetical protein